MKWILVVALVGVFIVGCNAPVMMDLDNHCVINYADGTSEDVVCSWARFEKPAFRAVNEGEIIIEFHDLSKRRVPMQHVRSWQFKYGDTDHWGRYVKVDGKWTRAKEAKR